MTWEEFLTTKFELWTDTRSSTDNTLHGSGKTVEKTGILLRCSGSFVIYWSQRDFNHWKVKHFRPWSKWKAMAEQGLCWRILESKNILMSIKDLDNCEISTRNAITATPRAKNILVVIMIIPSSIESSMFFFQSKLLSLLYIFLKHMTSFW